MTGQLHLRLCRDFPRSIGAKGWLIDELDDSHGVDDGHDDDGGDDTREGTDRLASFSWPSFRSSKERKAQLRTLIWKQNKPEWRCSVHLCFLWNNFGRTLSVEEQPDRRKELAKNSFGWSFDLRPMCPENRGSRTRGQRIPSGVNAGRPFRSRWLSDDECLLWITRSTWRMMKHFCILKMRLWFIHQRHVDEVMSCMTPISDQTDRLRDSEQHRRLQFLAFLVPGYVMRQDLDLVSLLFLWNAWFQLCN